MSPCIIAYVESSLAPLLPLFESERAAGRAVALGVLLSTAGSTYRRPGALVLIASSGEYAGLLSGGCLEGDLAQHALKVIGTGEARVLTYDLRHEQDLIWGMGAGCEGAMHILLLRVGPEERWQPLAHLAAAHESDTPTAIGLVAETADPAIALGTLLLPEAQGVQVLPACAGETLPVSRVSEALLAVDPGAGAHWLDLSGRCRAFLLPLSLAPRLLLLGGGPDAVPLAELAARLHWKVTVVDHRPAYATAERFASARQVVLARAQELPGWLRPAQFTAAVIMSHHLPTDLQYLRALSASAPPYIGLLGPAARREKLLAELGPEALRLRERLHAPVGLNLGGRSPEAIAVSIVAQILAFMHQRLKWQSK